MAGGKSMKTQQARAATRERLWSAYRSCHERRVREQLIDEYRDLVYGLLSRMGRRWDEDLEQVALIGLMKAVDRFDPGSGNAFSSYAVPTIVGEIKRYLRDQSRLVRPTRSLLDLRVRARAREAELTAVTGRSPTVAELAEALGLDLERVVEAMAMEETCHPRSLDALLRSSDSEHTGVLEQCLGQEDPELERVETCVACRQALALLEPRLRTVIQLRYYQNLTQKQAARRLGVSQMQVSRLERRALHQLEDKLVVV
jgi:RNA polymerase sigma-B factor